MGIHMGDPPRSTGTDDDTGTPRWVKVSGIIAVVLVTLVAVIMLVGGGIGGHGPGRHTPGGDAPGSHTGPPAGVTHE
jgi:hypothetical protein